MVWVRENSKRAELWMEIAVLRCCNERHLVIDCLDSYHHFDHHLFIIAQIEPSLLGAHISRLPFGHLSLWSKLTHPFTRHTAWPNQKQTRYLACASLPERVARCPVVSNMGRSATSALQNSVVAQVHLHQRRRLRVSKLRRPQHPPHRTNRQSQQATLSPS